MMKKVLLSLFALTLTLPLSAQGEDVSSSPLLSDGMRSALSQIEEHNTTLAALRARRRLDSETAREDRALPDPEVELGRHWGSAPDMQPRHIVGVTQSLDWGVLSGRKARAGRAGERVAETEYAVAAREVMLEAERTLVRMVYANRLCGEMRERERVAGRLAELYARRLERGDVSRMEADKVRLSHVAAVADAERAEAERTALAATLTRLNGGTAIAFADTAYVAASLPPLSDIMARAEVSRPEMVAAEAAIDRDRSQLRLSRTEALPEVSVGYTGELIRGASYNGVNVGLSLPLWGRSRAKVRRAEAALTLAELNRADARNAVRSSLAEQYATAQRLGQSADDLRAGLAETDNAAARTAALEAGQISLTEYLQELTFYYSVREALLQAERDSRLAMVGMM